MMEAELGSEFKYDPETNYDEVTMQQQRAIENEIAESQPLVGQLEGLNSLVREFENDPIYVEKIKKLCTKYKSLRRTRGDGNCFYRAFGYGYMETLLTDKQEMERFQPLAQNSCQALVDLGFPHFTIEDFHSVFMEVLSSVAGGSNSEQLLASFNDPSTSDYIVVYLRLLVSGHLQKEVDFYSCFVEGDRTMKEFCNQEVEPMGKESDHIHIITLASATGVPIRIEYMDRGGATEAGSMDVNHHDFPEGSTPRLTLLYRPGHYDILYE